MVACRLVYLLFSEPLGLACPDLAWPPVHRFWVCVGSCNRHTVRLATEAAPLCYLQEPHRAANVRLERGAVTEREIAQADTARTKFVQW